MVKPADDAAWPGWGPFRGEPTGNQGGRTTGRTRAGALPTLPDPPLWRQPGARRGLVYQPSQEAVEAVNAALCLGRPLLVTGKPGIGKTELAYAVAAELGLGAVLRWNITSRSTLKDGLYDYDSLGRLQDVSQRRRLGIGTYILLGPLATALLPLPRPRVLLIDEIDKADIDLPNDLLHALDEGKVEIPELARELAQSAASRVTRSAAAAKRARGPKRPRAAATTTVKTVEGLETPITGAEYVCKRFPFVILTSNGEREFPGPFLRRCIQLDLKPPDGEMLARIVDAHFAPGPDGRPDSWEQDRAALVKAFLVRRARGDLATDQLLNAVHMTIGATAPFNAGKVSEDRRDAARARLIDALLRSLSEGPVALAPAAPTEAP